MILFNLKTQYRHWVFLFHHRKFLVFSSELRLRRLITQFFLVWTWWNLFLPLEQWFFSFIYLVIVLASFSAKVLLAHRLPWGIFIFDGACLLINSKWLDFLILILVKSLLRFKLTFFLEFVLRSLWNGFNVFFIHLLVERSW